MIKSLSANRLPADVDPQRQQHTASNPAASVWVSASAGTGKTTVLTQRVARLLLDGVKPERILCITFTKAAAAEMSIRVTEKLSEWATCSDDELSRSIGELQNKPPTPKQMTAARRLFASALSCPGGMRIRTIHSFGQEVLRRFPIEAALPPHFVVIEENDAREMQEETLLALLRDLPTADTVATKALSFLVCELGEKNFRAALRDVLHDKMRLHSAVSHAGSSQKLAAQVRALLDLRPQDTGDKILREAIEFSVLPHTEIAEVARQLAEGSKSFIETAQNLKEWLAKTPEARVATFEEYATCFLTKEGNPRAKYANKELLIKYPDIDTILRREAERLIVVRQRLSAARMAEITEAILVLGLEWIRRYDIRKRMRAALDYDDLIIQTDRLLRKPGIAPWVLYKLDGGLDHILVDEAQDTSRAQWSIVKTLADEFFSGTSARSDVNRTLFVVGDEKQSIFSFQNADPEAFAEMHDYFSARAVEAKKIWQPVNLHVSFRSAPAVLTAVDAVFAADAARAGVSIEPVRHIPAPLRQTDAPKIGRVEVWPLIPLPTEDEESDGAWSLPIGYEDENDPQAALTARIADKIKGWIVHKDILPGQNRPIAAGDIMILLRRRGRFADLMVRALKKRGVAVSGVDRMHLIRQIAVMDLLALLQFTLLPEDDLNLATVLRGPMLNIGEDQLMYLALARKGNLWHALANKAATDPAFAAAYAYLTRWLNMTDFITPFAILAHILNEVCPGSARSGRHAIWSRLGPDALDPVEELLNAAQSFSRNHPPSLQAFLHWLTSSDNEIKRELDHSDGQVKIMTVHASKGLEAPIVFLPDTNNLPRPQDVPKLLWDGDVPLYTSRKPEAGAAQTMWENARQKQLEEYRRLLYVALTRAINRIYVCGWEVKKDNDNHLSWYNLVTEGLKDMNQPSVVEVQDIFPPMIAFADPILRAAKDIQTAEPPTRKTSLPAWALQPAPQEKSAPRTVAPSHIAQTTAATAPATATPDSAFARGRIIHRLLQSLPDMDEANREKAAARYLANPQHRLSAAQQAEILKEVMDLLRHPDYAPLFGKGSRAEVPIAGYVGAQPVSGQLDRLCLQDGSVWIVDYKTNRPPPIRVADVPEAYRVQLASYRAVLKEIYPDKAIRCFLLWTYGPRLMEIPDDALGA